MKESLRDWIEERKSRLGLEKGEIKAVLVGTRRTDPHGGESFLLLFYHHEGLLEADDAQILDRE